MRQLVPREEVELGASRLPVDLGARLVDQHDAAAEQGDVRVRIEIRELLREPVAEHHIVGVHPRDHRRLRVRTAGVERGG